MGMLAANHFLTVTEGVEDLRPLGEMVLWEGAKDVLFEVADEEMYVAIFIFIFIIFMSGLVFGWFADFENRIREFRQARKAKL